MQAKMIVFAAASPGQKEALDNWYHGEHARDLLSVPGMKAMTRYDAKLLKAPAGFPDWDFVAVYDIEGDDIDAVLRDLRNRPNATTTPALDSSKTLSLIAFAKGPDSIG